ncbi:MAG: hypothetical protein COA94_04220 [Rickettsiales bacterium]|nr:MAG: hypothetical protein COA94_04220 [Rickettsiales bacterium]
MKKILLTAMATTMLASPSAYAMEDVFYIKANAGLSQLSKIQTLKSKNKLFFGAGIGYNVIDSVRIELMLEHFSDPLHKKGDVKLQGKANTLMFNGLVNIFDAHLVNIFVGAGAGFSEVSAVKSGETDAANNGEIKKKHNLAFAGYLGASWELGGTASLEITYSYRDLGKTRQLNEKSFHYKGHHLSAGLRFDI